MAFTGLSVHFPTGVTFPCNVTMEDYVLNLGLLLSQDWGSNNFLKKNLTMK